ncbi:MAG: hypothetical protein M0R03_18470 [Novosphingobium sp.]|nr:hypothetical protein [Novosphingobium sp.]
MLDKGRTILGLAALALLAGCGKDEATPAPRERDPAVTGALGDPIMTDPDLVGQNQTDAGLSGLGLSAVDIPVEDRTPEAIAAAKAEAAKLAGGSLQSAPPPAPADAVKLARHAETAGQLAGATDPQCAARMEYTARWAARMPEPLTVYPRAAVREAAGTDQAGCRLRVVNFQTPVSVGDVMDFYYTRARKAGYSAERHAEGMDDVLGGKRNGATYVIYARKLANGLTEVDLVTNGE